MIEMPFSFQFDNCVRWGIISQTDILRSRLSKIRCCMFEILFPLFFIGLLFLIFLKYSSPKSLFGSDARKLGSASYKHWGVTMTLNIYELMKRGEQGQKMVGLEIRRTHATGFHISKMELPVEEVYPLIDALQKAVD